MASAWAHRTCRPPLATTLRGEGAITSLSRERLLPQLLVVREGARVVAEVEVEAALACCSLSETLGAGTEHQVFVLDAAVHRLGVRDNLSRLPGCPICPVGIGVRLLTRALAAGSEREEPLPRTHVAAVVCESANILELLVEEHHVLRAALVVRQRRPDKVCLDRRDRTLAATGRQSLFRLSAPSRQRPAQRPPGQGPRQTRLRSACRRGLG